MSRRLRPRRARRGSTALMAIGAVAILAILAHSLTTQALNHYVHAANMRDTIALQQLADSALAQALYRLSRGERAAAIAPVRESFGEAAGEISDRGGAVVLRVTAHVPSAQKPRATTVLVYRLEREGRAWIVAAVEYQAASVGESK